MLILLTKYKDKTIVRIELNKLYFRYILVVLRV